ncbi:MAG: hypothetical protein ACREP0_09235 [Rhodanobacteraceae bacterium]
MAPPSTPARSIAARTANDASVGPGVTLNSPRPALVNGVRAVDTMTAVRDNDMGSTPLCKQPTRQEYAMMRAQGVNAMYSTKGN